MRAWVQKGGAHVNRKAHSSYHRRDHSMRKQRTLSCAFLFSVHPPSCTDPYKRVEAAHLVYAVHVGTVSNQFRNLFDVTKKTCLFQSREFRIIVPFLFLQGVTSSQEFGILHNSLCIFCGGGRIRTSGLFFISSVKNSSPSS